MSRTDDRPADDIASAILDGTPIDWPSAEAHATGDERRLIDELRLLSTVADVHRPAHPDVNRQDQPLEEQEPATEAELATGVRAWHRRAARRSAWILLAALAVIVAIEAREWTARR